MNNTTSSSPPTPPVPELMRNRINYALVRQVLIAELANRRTGSAQVLNRAAVRGSNRKPWRQKGTGHARAGTRRSPLWRGGGVIFGPRPRSYAVHVPQSQRNAALATVCTLKQQESALHVHDSINITRAKTKELLAALSLPSTHGKTLLILAEEDPISLIRRAGANVAWLTVSTYNRISLHDIYNATSVILTKHAVQSLINLNATRTKNSTNTRTSSTTTPNANAKTNTKTTATRNTTGTARRTTGSTPNTTTTKRAYPSTMEATSQ